ncbi:hypothetical protein SAMN02745166_00786 [Prosthecobacter debontii]|uniref:Plasmid stabilization system protein ParE n=1 Tax=Prosthecobacter debontii TaxID=48467 RepID=A0A1T4WW72_9BACT|nr:hypothetical protein [Prosthecobacter debontii]SKA81610.1 hypothetical protein SAMN02745166_00786 [Prosthecobacter debontii]
MMDLIFLLGADIQSAFNQLKEQQVGRGYIFMQCLDAALTYLRGHPEIGLRYQTPYRRLLISKFPYGIFYEVQSQRVVLVAVMDLRQNPRVIRQHLFGK